MAILDFVQTDENRSRSFCLRWFLKSSYLYLTPCQISKSCHQVHDGSSFKEIYIELLCIFVFKLNGATLLMTIFVEGCMFLKFLIALISSTLNDFDSLQFIDNLSLYGWLYMKWAFLLWIFVVFLSCPRQCWPFESWCADCSSCLVAVRQYRLKRNWSDRRISAGRSTPSLCGVAKSCAIGTVSCAPVDSVLVLRVSNN